MHNLVTPALTRVQSTQDETAQAKLFLFPFPFPSQPWTPTQPESQTENANHPARTEE